MAAPFNDNWVNAQDIGFAPFAYTTGSNVSASAQSGEPSNNGRTVWHHYFYSASVNTPSQVDMFFTTTYNPTIGVLGESFKTVVQIFTSSNVPTQSVATMVEVSYLPGANWKSGYAGWNNGGYVAATLTPNQKYYIRVDSLHNDKTGRFPLTWGQYTFNSLNSCSQCAPVIGNQGVICRGSVSPDVLTGDATATWGNQNSGSYYLKYAGGAFNIDDTDPVNPQWTVVYNSPASLFSSFYKVEFFSQSLATSSLLENLPPTNKDGLRIYPTFETAQTAFQTACSGKGFYHSGGEIKMHFIDTGLNNANGNPNPTFCLYNIVPNFTIQSACASWAVEGSSASASFTILNNSLGAWDNVHISMANGGGISGASGTVVIPHFNPLGTQVATFTFNATTADVSSSLTYSSDVIPSSNTSSFHLFSLPVVQFGTLQLNSACNGKKNYFSTTQAKNFGNWSIDHSNYTASITNSFFIDNGSPCATHSIISGTFIGNNGVLFCNQVPAQAFFPTFLASTPTASHAIYAVNIGGYGVTPIVYTSSLIIPT